MILLAALASLLFGAEPAPSPLVLAQDTPVELRLEGGVSSATAKANDIVEFEVAEDVRAGDRIVIPRGSYAWGVVTHAERRSRMRRNGKLDIDLQAVCLPTGRPAFLRAVRRGTVDPDGTEVSASDSLFALPALPVMVFVFGKDVSIPAGRELTAYLAEDVAVTTAKGTPAAATRCVRPDPVPVPQLAEARTTEDLSTITVRSSPGEAEIYVNERFMGNTPAVLKLPPGEHQVRLALPGYGPWTRQVAVTPGGESNIQVKLETTMLVRKQEEEGEKKP